MADERDSEHKSRAEVATQLATGPAKVPPPESTTTDADDPEEANRLTGRIIDGRIQIKELLGAGGMGAVYRAWHTLMEKSLAFKVLHREYSEMEQLALRFQQEAKSTSRLDHPGIVRIHDFGRTDDGLLFLVMEHLSGRSLSDVLEAEGRLAIPRVLTIGRQICLALDHAHGQGIVHRDLKPDNVMVLDERTPSERIKLLDFGIAKVVQGEGSASNLTQAGAIFGTPSYMAPEQAAGDAVDHRADLYALGVMLFEMLAGAKPFRGETNAKLLMQHISETPPPIGQLAPDPPVPPSLEALVARALAKSPDERHASARELHDALAGVAQELGLATGSEQTAFPRMPTPSGVHAVAVTTPPAPTPSVPPTAQPTGLGVTAPPARTLTPTAFSGAATTAPVAVAQRRRWIFIGSAGGGGLVLLVLILVLALSGSDRERSGKRAPTSSIRRVEALLATDRTDDALPEIKRLVARYPKDARVHRLEAHACQKKKRLRECLPSYGQAIRFDARVREDKQLLALLYRLLTYRRSGSKSNASHQQAAQDFVQRHYGRATTLARTVTETLTRYVNKWHDAAAIWPVIGVLARARADGGVDYVHAYRQRFYSEQLCTARRAYIQQIVTRGQAAFIPLLQEIIKVRSFRAPSGKYRVKNKCIHKTAQKAILALGGNASDIPKTRKRKRGGSSIGTTLRRIFQ